MDLTLRRATLDDLPAVIALLADDELGRTREAPHDRAPYETSFAAIDADPNQLLVVGESAGRVVATMQLTYIRAAGEQPHVLTVWTGSTPVRQ